MASSVGNRLALANQLPVTASNHNLHDDSAPIHANIGLVAGYSCSACC